jgi:hypothetical protein
MSSLVIPSNINNVSLEKAIDGCKNLLGDDENRELQELLNLTGKLSEMSAKHKNEKVLKNVETMPAADLINELKNKTKNLSEYNDVLVNFTMKMSSFYKKIFMSLPVLSDLPTEQSTTSTDELPTEQSTTSDDLPNYC